MFKKIHLILRTITLIPHRIVFKCSKNHKTICADLDRWRRFAPKGETASSLYMFLFTMTFFKEFRNLFYMRVGRIEYLIKFLCKPLDTLYLSSKNIGPGFYIEHGFSTFLAFHSMGSNCMVNQQVTIGFTEKGKPTIGNNVNIRAGAKVIGDITIGDNVTIGAGAVIVKDVPSNCVVVGSKAYIVRKNGEKVREEL